MTLTQDPVKFPNWTQAYQWCNRTQEALKHSGPYSEGDLRIDHVEPVREPYKTSCFVGFSGPGHATLTLMNWYVMQELEAYTLRVMRKRAGGT